MKHMEIAWSQIGQSEVQGKAANPQIVEYFAASGHPNVASDEVPWCAAFVGWCLEQAGIRSTRSLMARSYLNHGTPIDQPRVGCIVVFPRGSNPVFGHVGFVSGITPDTLVVLGGNQANTISLQHFPRAKALGYRWPVPPKSPGEVAKASKIAKAAGQQKTDVGVATGAGVSDAAIPAPPADVLSPEILTGQAQKAQGMLDIAINFAMFCWAKAPWIAALLVIYFGARAAWNAWRIRKWRAEDENTGAHEAKGEPAHEAEGGDAWQGA